jgi:hypothetical protein
VTTPFKQFDRSNGRLALGHLGWVFELAAVARARALLMADRPYDAAQKAFAMLGRRRCLPLLSNNSRDRA